MIPASYLFKNAFDNAWIENNETPKLPAEPNRSHSGLLQPMLRQLQRLWSVKANPSHSGVHAYH